MKNFSLDWIADEVSRQSRRDSGRALAEQDVVTGRAAARGDGERSAHSPRSPCAVHEKVASLH
jgi:hypothetical protein